MRQLLICRTCGTRAMDELATNQKELADVGMLERHCIQCSSDTRWGLAQDYRRAERRAADRRHTQRRARAGARVASERRAGSERRSGPVRATERRRAAGA